uniref:RBR-type E3 ubiquitin transferase n=1 Tax=Cacopsylla melanoneura TaxID=428564 RepID=A0A8D8RP90_9HEMI
MRKHSNSNGEKPCSFSRFSLRRLLYSSPLLSLRHQRSTKSSKHHVPSPETQSTCHDVEKGIEACPSTSPRVFVDAQDDPTALYECPLCCAELTVDHFPKLLTCPHRSCLDCLQQYLRIEISESRVALTCPECPEPLHPLDIHSILQDQAQFEKYEDFMVRRVLSVEPDTRWCPTPDCGFAVIATGCASCPRLRCGRPGCHSYFCYNCKAAWHPNQTCDAARAQRSPPLLHASSVSFSLDSSQNRDDLKACPRCQVLILKMDDGSCNHMTCAVCGAEFCWLCLKEISDLHYLSPSGCTFWGTKPWSRKKKILWQLGTLVGAPVGIALVAGIAIPAMIIGIPVWVGRKLYTRYEHMNKYKRNMIVTGGVVTSVLIAPVLAGLAVGIGVPILLFYVYGVVPVSLCRSGGCGVSTSPSGGVRFDFDDEESIEFFSKGTDPDAISHPNVSIGEASDKDSVSMMPLTGSIASNTRSLITQSSQGVASSGDTTSARIANDDGSSERVRFDDNVSIIEHTPAVVTRSPRNRVSSTLRSIFFKNNTNTNNSGNRSSTPARSSGPHQQEPSLKRQPLAPLSKGGQRKLPKIPFAPSCSSTSSEGSNLAQNNKKIVVEVTLSDLHVPTSSSLTQSSSSNSPSNQTGSTLDPSSSNQASTIVSSSQNQATPDPSSESVSNGSPVAIPDSSILNPPNQSVSNPASPPKSPVRSLGGSLSNGESSGDQASCESTLDTSSQNQASPKSVNSQLFHEEGSSQIEECLPSVHSPCPSVNPCTIELGVECLDTFSEDHNQTNGQHNPPLPTSSSKIGFSSSSSVNTNKKPKKLRSLENLNRREIANQIQKQFFRSFENLSGKSKR